MQSIPSSSFRFGFVTASLIALAGCGGNDDQGAGGTSSTSSTTTSTSIAGSTAASTSITTTAATSSSTGLGPAPAEIDLDVNDVSFLWPPSDLQALPPLSDFLTQSELDQSQVIDALTGVKPTLDAMKVVGIRVDPCFPGPQGCELQVRLVAQQVTGGLFVDSAIHLFFVQPLDARPTLRAHLAHLHDLALGRTKGKPLGPHPVLSDEGAAGPYAVALREMLSWACAPDRLREIAVMNGAEATWTFSRFSVQAGNLTSIPTTGGAPNTIPATANVVLLRKGLLAVDRVLDPATPMTLERLAIVRRFENPSLSPTPTIDCGSCHAASQGRVEAESTSGLSSAALPETFVPPIGFTATNAHRPGPEAAFRAFGYTEDKTPSIIDRAVFESILSAADLAHP